MVGRTEKRYPLQIAISALFISITIVLGIILSWQSYSKTSDIMLSSAADLYERISQELILDFKASYGSMIGSLHQFRLSPVIHASTFNQRITYLPAFKAVLSAESSVFAAGIAYPNGDYLGVSRADSDYVQREYKVPDNASFIIFYSKGDNAEAGFEIGKLYIIYYDEQLIEIGRKAAHASQFDPRQRPWYKQATAVPATTSPYLFYESKIVGLTAMSKTPVAGVVVVFDITLENLSQTINKYQVTENSEVVLINAQGQVFAYRDQQKIIVQQEKVGHSESVQLAGLHQLGSEVLVYISKNLEAKEQNFEFEYAEQTWIGSARIVAKPGDIDLYALMLSPVDELLVDAVAIRWHLLLIAFFAVLVFIPVIWFSAKKISKPLNMLSLQAKAISRFKFNESVTQGSSIKEVHQLDTAMAMMTSTINKFINLINSLAGEQDLDLLIRSITQETMSISQADAAIIYLIDEKDDLLKANFLCDKDNRRPAVNSLLALNVDEVEDLLNASESVKSCIFELDEKSDNKLLPLLKILSVDTLTTMMLPLRNRNNETIGLLCLLFKQGSRHSQESNIAFVEALSGFAAVTLESRQSLNMQEALLQAFIKLIAGAIDAKSPYTGGHCMRVPEITLMLAKAACDSNEGKYKNFSLNEEQWKELSIAGWLHDCGKVTTPEYVVDKATKLETIYDRIHEIRMRFEVLKRDVEIDCWQQIAGGGNKKQLLADLGVQQQTLNDDFSFVAECNVGGEFMADEKIERLQSIAVKTWQRTFDDNLGLSWEELKRKSANKVTLPVEEKLLANKPEHLIPRLDVDKMPADNPWGFKLDVPEYKYNRGELYNLSVKKGTLSEEERYMINGHMIQTIIMLNNLPYPKSLRNVPLIAGSHHETMDGKGYPKKLVMSEQPETARMMVIADIFEALTASDRPYKKAKTLSESLRILSFMRNDKHIDADLFDLFLSSGIYLQYANKFLLASQIDDVDIADYRQD